jgi:opacity protein-like surface antigen
MKKIALLSLLCASFFVPSAVKAADVEGFYLGATGAASFVQTSNNHRRHHQKYDTGFFGAIDLGYRWCNGFHLEAEVAYIYNKDKKHNNYYSFNSSHRRHRDVWAGMVNGLYEFDTCWGVEPYVGIGLGYAHVKHGINNDFSYAYSGRRHASHNSFAYQVIAGVAYPICDNIDLAVEYRFFDAVNSRSHAPRVYNHNVGLNLKYYF